MIRKEWIWLPALNLMLAVLFGTILRMAFVVELRWIDFRHFLHAHSHVAMLGWVFPVLFIFLFNAFQKPTDSRPSSLNGLLWSMMVVIILMGISYALSGYSLGSGILAGIHGIISYFMIYKLWPLSSGIQNASDKFLKAAIFFYVFSTIGVWLLPLLVATGQGGSISYYLTIQFYLHFQFNGWFIFAVFALIFKDLEVKGIGFSERQANLFFWALFVSCFLTYALALSWASPLTWVFMTNSVGVLIQVISLIFLSKLILANRKDFFSHYLGFTRNLFIFSMIAFYLKVVVQFMVWIPEVATVAYTIRNLVIGFFHLVFLGVVSLFAFAYGVEKGYLSVSKKWGALGLWIFTAGVILTELIIFGQGIMFWGNMGFLPGYYHSLFFASCLFPIGLGIFFLGQIGSRTISSS